MQSTCGWLVSLCCDGCSYEMQDILSAEAFQGLQDCPSMDGEDGRKEGHRINQVSWRDLGKRIL